MASQTRPCPFCGSDAVDLCPSCGRDITASRRICKKCGRQTPKNESQCVHCHASHTSSLVWKLPLIVFIFLLAFALSIAVAMIQ